MFSILFIYMFEYVHAICVFIFILFSVIIVHQVEMRNVALATNWNKSNIYKIIYLFQLYAKATHLIKCLIKEV